MSREKLNAIEANARAGHGLDAPDVLRLVGRVLQLEAVCVALEAERNEAAAAAVGNGIALGKMRELVESGAPEPTQLAGFKYWLREADGATP